MYFMEENSERIGACPRLTMKRHTAGLARIAALLLFVACGCSREANFDIPPSLVSKMYQAHNAFRDNWLGKGAVGDGEELMSLMMLGFDNAIEIAQRPRGEMSFAYDGFSDEQRKNLWPFDIESFEASLEAQLGRGENGLYGLKLENGEGLEPSNPTIRWANGEIETWAVKQLDSKFKRMEKSSYDEMMALLEEGEQDGESDDALEKPLAWIIAEDDDASEYFLIIRNGGAWDLRSYVHVIWDRNLGPCKSADFDSFPSKKEATAMLTWRKNPCSLNNMAVLQWRHRTFRVGMDPGDVKVMLEAAADGHVKCASKNMAVLLKHIPEIND